MNGDTASMAPGPPAHGTEAGPRGLDLSAAGPSPGALLGLGLGYLAIALLSIELSRQPGSVASIWYANAIGVAALSAWPTRRWALAVAVLAVAVGLANLLTGTSAQLALAFVAGNLLEMGLGAALVRRAGLAGDRLHGPRSMGLLLLLGGVLPQLVGASVGAATLAASGLGQFGALWLPWFEGSVIGAVSMLPLAFLVAHHGPREVGRSLADARLWAFAPAIVGIALLALVELPNPFVYLLLPLLLAATLLSTAAVSALTLLASVTVAVALAWGVYVMPPMRAEWQQVLVYMGYAAALLPGLFLVATMSGLRQTQAELEAGALRLRRAHEGLQRFVHVASHDLREPLNTVRQFGGLLQAEESERLSAPGQRYLGLMVAGTERMRTLLDDLLAFARVEHGEAVPMAPVELDRIFAELRETLHHRLETSGGRLDVPPGLPVVQGHAVLLLLLFQNLVANGLKFVAPGTPPHVEVRARRVGGQVVVEVRDHGIGIAPAQQGRLFEPFYRVHLRRQYEGSGLGLATARHIARIHGGDITLASEPGAGSCFSVTLAAAAPESGTPADAPP